MTHPLLRVRNLTTVFATGRGEVVAVEDVSFDLAQGEVLGIVGESGSGKSVTALSIMGLLPQPPGRVAKGEVWLESRNLLTLSEGEMRRIRGNRMGMIFQEPMTSLNPVFPVGNQIMETLRVHQRLGGVAARARAVELLAKVGIPSPERRIDDYPHQLSGGQRQRVMIAMALACSPQLLIADEPTTALDVTIQAQILDLLRQLQEEFRMAVIIITHNMGVVAEFAHRVIVMYAGRVVEQATVDEIFDHPAHPYTEGLLHSIPDMESDARRLTTIPGVMPSPFALPPGCRFQPRCAYARPVCGTQQPPLIQADDAHVAACIRLTDYRFPFPQPALVEAGS
ncbi:MAG: ABC transporter ATP-binding protein [Proteobacteria bacterium]|nr:ABC transporter ATP-binding protein [Pseudomonadota bacterium]MBI3499810.1 ABC transporter ATP-binding protein [Pseudomonadota bacterium]